MRSTTACSTTAPTELKHALAESGTSQRRYWLAPHICACLTPEGAILLDLKRDRYLGASPRDSALLARIVVGWPSPVSFAMSPSYDACDVTECYEAANTLVKAGVLLVAKPVSNEETNSASVSLSGLLSGVGDEIGCDGIVRPSHVATFLSAYFAAEWTLRFFSLYSIAKSIRSTKKKHPGAARTFDVDRASELIDVFRQLRPFFFSADGKCLLHALTLVHFLARYELFADWVIGVKTRPWAAHSWAQSGTYVLDSNPEKICAYTPILIV